MLAVEVLEGRLDVAEVRQGTLDAATRCSLRRGRKRMRGDDSDSDD